MKKMTILLTSILSIVLLTGCSKWVDKGQSITAV